MYQNRMRAHNDILLTLKIVLRVSLAPDFILLNTRTLNRKRSVRVMLPRQFTVDRDSSREGLGGQVESCIHCNNQFTSQWSNEADTGENETQHNFESESNRKVTQ